MGDHRAYEARRFGSYEALAIRRAAQRGHQLSQFDFEHGWYAAVATCILCKMLAAIDLSERPYLFGRAYKNQCKAGRRVA